MIYFHIKHKFICFNHVTPSIKYHSAGNTYAAMNVMTSQRGNVTSSLSKLERVEHEYETPDSTPQPSAEATTPARGNPGQQYQELDSLGVTVTENVQSATKEDRPLPSLPKVTVRQNTAKKSSMFIKYE